DGPDLELVLLARALRVGIVEEVRRRLVELAGHVLERAHRRPDLAELDRTHVRAREIRGAELRLRDAGGEARLAKPVAELLERGRHRRRTAPSHPDLGHRRTVRGRDDRVNLESTGLASIDCGSAGRTHSRT